MTTHTVLYIEDNVDSIHLVRRILRLRPDVVLLVAPDGVQGLATAEEALPSLILLDLHLPGLGGEEVLLRLKSVPRTASIPIVVVSGASVEPDNSAMPTPCAAYYLQKPFALDEFLAVVDRFCAPRPMTSDGGV